MENYKSLRAHYIAARRGQWRQMTNTRRLHRYDKTGDSAVQAIAKARAAVAESKSAYHSGIFDSDWQAYQGLRFVGRVKPDFRRGDPITKHDGVGWHTNPFGDVFKDGFGLCFGVVYMLPGKNGRARYVSGYQFGGIDGGPDLDFSTIWETERGDYSMSAPDGLTSAAREADRQAQRAAEKEREYQTAWQAGSKWREESDSVKTARRETLELLKEMKGYRRLDSAPAAICKALRAAISANLSTIAEARRTMAELAAGDYSRRDYYLGFYKSSELCAAFNDGAGSEVI